MMSPVMHPHASNGFARVTALSALAKHPEEAGVLYTPQANIHYCACVLRRVSTLTAVGIPKDEYEMSFRRRQTELLSCLAGGRDERITYDLRFVSHPNLRRPARGRITIGLLCRMSGYSFAEAGQHACGLQRLLDALFDEHRFELASADEVGHLLAPFAITYIRSLTRRAWLGRLDSLRRVESRSPVGFTRSADLIAPVGPPADAIVHIAPYLAARPSFETLFKLLLSEPEPVAISVRLRPASLAPDEEAFLEEQIARCERYTQVSLGQLPADLSTLAPTLREQAMLYQQYQARMLFALKASAALMTVHVVSTRPVSAVTDALGALVTLYGGGTPGGESFQQRALAGGYDVSVADGEAEIDAFQRLEIPTPPHAALSPLPARLLHLFDLVEAANVFRLPPAALDTPPGLTAERWRSGPPPDELPEEGILLGISVHRGTLEPIHLPANGRRGSTYVIGATGTGKTSLLTTWIVDAMQAGKGLSVIDPHSDLVSDVLGKVPREREKDVVLVDPADGDRPVGLNLLECETDAQRHFIANEFVGIMSRLLRDEFGAEALSKFAGPVFFQHLRMNLLLAMSNPEDPGTLLEVHGIYNQKDYWRRWLPLKMADPLLERWVQHVLPRTDYLRPDSDGMSMGTYVGSKFERFVFNPLLRRIFGQKRSTIDLKTIMDEGKILLVNLASGQWTEENARFLGMVILAKLMAAGMARVTVPGQRRREFQVYVDEWQNLATGSFVTLLAEARKFGVTLTLANQFLSQVDDPRIVQAVLTNVSTLVSFRLGHADAALLEREFLPAFNRFDLANLPNWRAYVKTLIDGVPARPFSIQTVPDPVPFDPAVAERVRRRSRRVYGRPCRDADAQIAASLVPRPREEEKADRTTGQ